MAEYISRLVPKPSQSFFLFGPRGTGKTTWVRHEFPAAHTINLLDESPYQTYLADVSRFAGEPGALPDESWIFVDEIQRLPNLLNEVHRFIGEKHHRFILTASSARELKRADVNLLAVRALLRRMHPFAPMELRQGFDLEEVLLWGSIPLVWSSGDKKETFKAYVQMYLKEEIKAEVGRTTFNGYLEILEDTLLAFRLPTFEAKLRLRERKHPKLYWIDPGLVRAAGNRYGELHPQERGVLFEGLIASVLRACRDLKGIGKRILVYLGDRTMKTSDGIDVWSFARFVDNLDVENLWGL